MRISVDRTSNKDGDLVFVVTCRDPKCNYIDPLDIEAIRSLETTLNYTNGKTHGLNMDRVSNFINEAKRSFFEQLRRVIADSIQNELCPKYEAMVQELYNWAIDSQEPFVRNWMLEFDMARTKYYFDNDKTVENTPDESEERFSDED